MPQTPDDIIAQFSEAVINAKSAYQNAAEQLAFVLSQLDAIPEPTDISAGSPGETTALQRKALQQRADTLQKTYNDAQQSYTDVLAKRAQATNAAKTDADPATQARLKAQADADTARAEQIKLEATEFKATAPERRAAAQDAARLGKAKADEAEYNLALAKETDPERRAGAQANVDRAKAETARITAETSQIGKPAPRTPEQTRADAAQATTAEAVAGTAGGTAEAALRKAVADADKAVQELTNAQTEARQKPTDQQAQQAIQNALRNQDLARQQLEQAMAQAGNLNPTLVDQAKATLANTRASTQLTQETIKKGQQGDLYGLQDKITQIRDLIASGEIKPAQGDQMIAAAQRGTNIYDVLKQEQSDRSTARTQDISSKNQQMSTFGSMANSGLNTFQEMNKTGAIGSDATGKAYLGMLEMARQSVADYAPSPAQQTDYLGGNVSGLVNAAQQQIAPTPAGPAQPVAPASGAQPITINIGSGAASNPQPQMAAPGPSGPYSSGGLGPVAAGGGGDMLASMAARQTPASKGEVLQTLFPNVAKKYGLGTI